MTAAQSRPDLNVLNASIMLVSIYFIGVFLYQIVLAFLGIQLHPFGLLVMWTCTCALSAWNLIPRYASPPKYSHCLIAISLSAIIYLMVASAVAFRIAEHSWVTLLSIAIAFAGAMVFLGAVAFFLVFRYAPVSMRGSR